jgi:hypothetical protein
LYTALILGYPQRGEKFIVDTDAINIAIGGILSQVKNGMEQVIANYSKAIKKAERNCWVTNRELLAIMKTMKHFHKHLYRKEFQLSADHCAPTWLNSFKNLEGQIPVPPRIFHFRLTSGPEAQ